MNESDWHKILRETTSYLQAHNIASVSDLTESDVDAIYAAAGVPRVKPIEQKETK